MFLRFIITILSFFGLGLILNWMALRAIGIADATSRSAASKFAPFASNEALIIGFVFLGLSLVIGAFPWIWMRYTARLLDEGTKHSAPNKDHLRVVK